MAANAEKKGFEPLIPFGILVFETSALNRTLPLLQSVLCEIRTHTDSVLSAVPLPLG
jgi:hypothetical protein